MTARLKRLPRDITLLRQRASSLRSRRFAVLIAVLYVVTPTAVLADGVVRGSSAGDVLRGTPGADSIFGLEGNDKIDGAAGDDDLDGGPGGDDMSGGAGTDSVLYGGRNAAVVVTIDDVADDGEQGEGDNVRAGVEQIFGGDGGDRLQGSARAELIDGGGGDDSIIAGRGSDRVYGGPGNDVISTFDGAVDVVDCGAGDDTVTTDYWDARFDCEQRLPAPDVGADVKYRYQPADARTTSFPRLVLTKLPRGATVEVRCRGGGCPFRFTRLKPKPGQTRITLTRLVRGRRLRAGTTLEVAVTKPGTIGYVNRLRMRDGGRAPVDTELCLPPGSDTPRGLDTC